MILSTMPWLKVSSIENENLKLKLLHDFLVRSFIRNLGWEVWALTNIVDEEAHSVRGGAENWNNNKNCRCKAWILHYNTMVQLLQDVLGFKPQS